MSNPALAAQSDPTTPNRTNLNQSSTELTCSGLGTCLVVLTYYIGPALASYVAYIGAYFFSVTISLSLNSTAYALQFLTDGWTTVRDLSNMAFIFILIYIAMTVMLRAETAGTIKTLSIVVVVALLVNFSFFFTRVVIDTGNILAVQFYNAIPQQGGLIPGTQIKDLSSSLMGAIKPQSLLSGNLFDQATKATDGTTGAVAIYVVVYLSMAAMLWAMFFVFIQVGVKFMMRIVGLWFVLMVSPLAFVARTLKQTEHYFTRWLHMLVQFSIYPAVFLFIFLILTKFAGSMATVNTTNGGDFFNSIIGSIVKGSADGNLSVMGAIASAAIRMGFIIAVMYVGLKVSDSVVKEGSALTSKAGSWGSGLARSAVRYGPGWAAGAAYRRTGGALANLASKGVQNTAWANRTGTIRGAIGYRLNKNVLKPLTETSLGTVASSYKERGEFLDKRKKEMDTNLENLAFKKDSEKLGALNAKAAPLEARLKELEEDEKASGGTLPVSMLAEKARVKKELDAMSTERATLGKNIEKASGSQVAMLGSTDVAAIIKQVSESQLKAVKDSNKHSLDTIHALTTQWHEENKKAPLAESKKQLEELGKIHKELKKKGLDTASIAPLFDKLAQSVKGDVTSLKAAEDAKKEIIAARETQEEIKDNLSLDDKTGKAARAAAGQKAKELKKAEEKLDKLMEKLKEVPANVGGEAAPAAFKH